MRFALWGAMLCAALAATAPVHVRGSARGVAEGRPVEVTVDREGDRELVRACSSGVCDGTWFDGTTRWRFGINEILVPDERPAGDYALLAQARAAAVPVDGPLAPPAGPALSLASAATVPLSGDPVPVVPCRLAGHSARCLLDSGTTPSLITLQQAEALGLEARGALDIVGFATVTTGIVTSGPLVLGAATFDRVSFAVVPRSQAVGFDVVIGADLLRRLEVVLDHSGRTARVAAPGTVVPAHPIPLRFRAGVPVTGIELGGRAAEALVDTGDSAILSEGYGAYREGPQWPVVGRTTAAGIGGSDDVLDVALPSAAIGPVPLGPTRMLVRRTQREAHVGVGLWTHCALAVDEANATMGC